MHNNYYFIRQIVKELDNLLPGLKLIDAYSQNKDEAILSFFNIDREFHIISHLTGQFTCLAFPSEFSKARKNTAPLFKDLIGKKVLKVIGYANERAFRIQLEDNLNLVFKLFGRQANLILFKDEQVVEIFRKGFKTDQELTPEALNRDIDQSLKAIQQSLPKYREVFPTLHKKMVNEIDNKIEGKVAVDQAESIQMIIQMYENPIGYLITNNPCSLKIATTDPQDGLIVSALHASTSFFFKYLKDQNLDKTKSHLIQNFSRQIGKTEVYITKVRKKLKTIEHDTNHRIIADLLMANLNNVPPNSSIITLPNFYNSDEIRIKLNPRQTVQQNAERYYKKSKNVNLEIENLSTTLKSKEKDLAELKKTLKEIESANDIKSLRRFDKSEKTKVKSKEVPFKQFNVEGYIVYVGNNAKQNDLLTLKYAKKDDLFFHAKDVSGSHVILKNRPGTNAPTTVLETTASIAAYYSKRKTDTLCPVGYTEKKYVRKPKGSPPGLVLVEREKVLLVTPQLPTTQQR